MQPEKDKGSEPEVIDHLKVAAQVACSGAEYALKELKVSCKDAYKRFGLVSTRLTPLETTTPVGPSGHDTRTLESDERYQDLERIWTKSRKQGKANKVK